MNPIYEWIDSAGNISWTRWENFQSDYFDKRGVRSGLTRSDLMMYMPQHPAMEGAYVNSDRLIPNDVATRLRNTEDFEVEFTQIIEKTYERMESSIEADLESLVDRRDVYQEASDIADSKSGQLAYLCSVIISQLRGDVRIAQLRKSEIEIPSDPAVEPPEYSSTITVERRNERNMLDVATFLIDNPVDFFGSRYGDSTLMLEAIVEAGIEPEHVVLDEAFETEGGPWVKSEPPSHPITIRTTDRRNKASFEKISDPQDYYGDSWGDIQEMIIEIGNSDEGLEKREFLCNTERIAWRISIGI